MILLKVAVDTSFRTIGVGLSEEQKIKLKQLNLDDLPLYWETESAMNAGTSPSKKALLSKMETALLNHVDSIGSSINEIKTLFQHLRYLNHLRNHIVHFGKRVEQYITLSQKDPKKFLSPDKFGIKEELDKKCQKYRKPYWWRIIKVLYKSAREIHAFCVKFKFEILITE